MKVVIKEENKTKLWIGIPSCLLFNGFTAIFAKKALQKEDGIKISRKQLAKFFKELNKYRRRHRDWVICEVESGAGDNVFIKL